MIFLLQFVYMCSIICCQRQHRLQKTEERNVKVLCVCVCVCLHTCLCVHACGGEGKAEGGSKINEWVGKYVGRMCECGWAGG